MIDFNIYNGFDPQNKSVLIVDDNPQNLKVLEAMLNTIGISVRAARSGDECLKSIAKEKPDLILLDIHMPGIDGYEVCKTISLDKELSLIPVIFVSALSEEFNKEQAFKCGGVDYTTKPFDLKDVELRVKTHLILKEKTEKLKLAIENLANNEKIMIQSEKMAAIGILSAGIAHEINNPINFISNSFKVLTKDIEDIKTSKGKDKLDRLISDFDNINLSITAGIDYITNIVKGLRIYCGSEESEKVAVSVNNIIDSALTILYHRYKNHINIIKNYGNLNDILSYPAKLSQVFINLISNSIDSIDESCIKVKFLLKQSI